MLGRREILFCSRLIDCYCLYDYPDRLGARRVPLEDVETIAVLLRGVYINLPRSRNPWCGSGIQMYVVFQAGTRSCESGDTPGRHGE